jgi:hypothetical protein
MTLKDAMRRRGNTARRPIVVKVELKWHELPDAIAESLFDLIDDEHYSKDILEGRVHYTTELTIR